ncbi:MAG TPA: HPF/RaiA family ribosome-associated protein [Burkholderiales bacterium]|jgi:Sigma 54 modulation protein / S30EA ribosomal protein|nr:HPF/RaiA family ribosome-associated protein [Burkholderiales bacterium]
MQIQINSDHRIPGTPALAGQVQSLVRDTFERYSDRITRVEVHLSDLNGLKGGSHDKRCLMEARLSALGPVAVDHEADNLDVAISGALEKLEHAIAHKLGKQSSSAHLKRSVIE